MNISEQAAYRKLEQAKAEWQRIASEQAAEVRRVRSVATLALRSEDTADWKLALEVIAGGGT